MNKTPKVSIVAITYNHERYIREALDSFVMQQTDFTIEVVIADDCSTDKTPEIIEEYTKKYPEIFRPILRKKNIGAVQNSLDALRAGRGKYIALCEGDDYWSDPKKLQKQADFLDKHPDYALCFHPVKVIYENGVKPTYVFPDTTSGQRFTLRDLLERNFIQTNSVMYRRQSYDKLPNNVLPLDWYYHLYHAQFGKIGIIKEPMAVYRRHPGGIWWDSEDNLDAIWLKYGIPHLALYVEILKLHGHNSTCRDIVEVAIFRLLRTFVGVDERHDKHIVRQAFENYPILQESFIKRLVHSLTAAEQELRQQTEEQAILKERLQNTEADSIQKDQTIEQLIHELALIKNSKVWKMRNKLAKAVGRKVIS